MKSIRTPLILLAALVASCTPTSSTDAGSSADVDAVSVDVALSIDAAANPDTQIADVVVAADVVNADALDTADVVIADVVRADAAPIFVGVMPDFSLQDENATSASAASAVSPRDYLEKVSGWYFGHST